MVTNKTIEQFLTESECNDIIEYSIKNYTLETAKLAETRDIDVNVRKSNIAHINYGVVFPELIYKVKNEIVPLFNLKGVEIDSTLGSTFQFTKYGLGDFYDWHRDSVDKITHISNKRYCSIVIQLNNDYDGGELQMKVQNTEDIITFKRGTGNMFIFLSDTIHRVAPVSKGVRYSLVGWFYLKEIKSYKKTLL